MLEKLPFEIQLIILNQCSFKTLMRLRQVCWLYKTLAENQLHKKTEFDVVTEYFGMYDGFSDELFDGNLIIFSRKLISFLLNYMPEVRKLSLRSTPIRLQLAELIQLAKAVPLLGDLDLSQVDNKPFFGKDAMMGLPYFCNLKTLKLDGFCVRRTTGCSYRLEIPPIKRLLLLENFEILEGYEGNCRSDMICGILFSLRESSTVLSKLQCINFGVRQCHKLFPELLIWFLLHHKSLRSIRLHNILFETSTQLRKFYNALVMLPQLAELQLDRCDQVGETDLDTQIHFVRALNSKGISLTGFVRSLHPDPNRIY